MLALLLMVDWKSHTTFVCYCRKLLLIFLVILIVFLTIRYHQFSQHTRSHQVVDAHGQTLHSQWPPENVKNLFNARTNKYELHLRPWVIPNSRLSVGIVQSFSNLHCAPLHQTLDTNKETLHSQWSPKDVRELFNARTNKYELHLRPWVIPGSLTKSFLRRYYQLLTVLQENHIERGSWHYRGYQMEKELRIDPDAYNYHLFPQPLDLEHVVKRIRAGKPIKMAPINNPVLPVLQAPKDICKPQTNNTMPFDLLVLIKSCVRCRNERDHARQTFMQRKLWGDFRIQFVFVTGLPASNYSSVFHFDGLQIKHQSHGNEKNDAKRVREQLFEESMLHHDLLIGEFEDHYFCLTIKQLFAFRWISAFCRGWSKLYLWMDNDFSLIPDNLIRLINGIPDSVRADIYVGISGTGQKVRRSSKRFKKWCMSENEFPWPRFAPFNSGEAFLLGERLILDVSIALSFVQPLRLEDANLGTTMFKLHTPAYSFSWFRRKVQRVSDLRNVACVGTEYADQYVDWGTGRVKMYFWDILQDFIYLLPP